MRQNDGDHRHAGRSVEVLRDLHPVDIRERERKEEQDARYGKRRSSDDDRPENQLLASIEPRRGRMRLVAIVENATAGLQPGQVVTIGEIVLYPYDQQEKNARHMAPGDGGIGESRLTRQRGESVGTEKR